MKLATCTITDTASSTNNPPMIASTSSCLVTMLIVPSAAPIANEPVSPMKTLAGGALNQRKPSPAPTIAAQNTDKLAGAGHVVQLQVVGENRVADEIGDKAKAAGRDHRRPDRQAVETVGQIDRVRGAGNDQNAERQENQPRLSSTFLKNGTATCWPAAAA